MLTLEQMIDLARFAQRMDFTTDQVKEHYGVGRKVNEIRLRRVLRLPARADVEAKSKRSYDRRVARQRRPR